VHVLTKIFIVLVTLLAVLLVPLVVVYAYNEDQFKAKFEQATAQADSARLLQQQAEARLHGVEARLQARIDEVMQENRELRTEGDRRLAEVRDLEAQAAAAETLKAETFSKLATLASAVEAAQQLTDSLIGELRTLRQTALASERQKVELDEALRDVSSQLEVAVAARRALDEELQRLKDEHARALDSIALYVSRYGSIGDEWQAGQIDIIPDRDLDSTIISVRRSPDQTLAEIDAGSRDGVEEGWTFTVAHGGVFKAKLRIIAVDINRATGILELEDAGARGEVEVGHRAYVRAGRE
jgi:ABC-type transporter Mla subunit MlaD